MAKYVGGGMGFPGKAGWFTTIASLVSTGAAAGATFWAPIPLGPATAKSSAALLTMSTFGFFLLVFFLLSLIDGTRTDCWISMFHLSVPTCGRSLSCLLVNQCFGRSPLAWKFLPQSLKCRNNIRYIAKQIKLMQLNYLHWYGHSDSGL